MGGGAIAADVCRAGASRRVDLTVAWLIFLALAYLPNLAPQRSINLATLTAFWAFFAMTLIILCDQVTIALGHRSLLQEATRTGKAWVSLLIVGAISGLLLDGIAQWLGKLWIYPYWNEALYASTFVVGFCAYWLATAESYLAVKAIFMRHRAAPARMQYRPGEVRLFAIFGTAGAILAISGVVLLVRAYQRAGGYIFDTRKPAVVENHFVYFLITFAGVWLVLEWIQFVKGYATLLKSILHGRWIPLSSLLVASCVFALFWETVNAAHHFWIYTNWPLPQWHIMTIPVTVLLTWPLQYVVFLSLGFLLGFDLWA